jgi:PrcB C-terminal
MMRIPILCLLAASACARIESSHISVVMSHGNCQQIDAGASVVDYADLARLRGANLIGMTEAPVNAPATADAAASADAEAVAPLTLIAVSLGTRPTPGYSMILLDGGTVQGEVLTARVGIEGPPTDAVLAQMVTHPCIVLGVAERDIRRVRIEDGSGALIGEVSPNR